MSQAPYPQPGPQQPGPRFQQVPGQPYPPQQPIKPRKAWYKRPWFWILVAVVVIIIGVNGSKGANRTAGSGTEAGSQATTATQQTEAATQTRATTSPQAAPQAEKAAGMNEAVDAGDLQYTVTKVQTGVSTVGDQYVNQQPQGQYVLVTVSVKNTGKSATTFDSSLVKLYDKNAAQYSTDTTAEIYANKQNTTFLQQVNPGNTAKGVLVFDIPKDVQPTQLGVRGGLFGSEKKISLS
ncbi:DUF4352 domain-containing protein [Raineyella sp.]|uniref:DUF4352 domain-containing protein n=1 Tax=bioreactor metagenome TaxID=1076179 RepID=A0A644YKE3_9ZZZZ|nr:DUF4352 domain-containing protein [Raineyella sp.]MEA5154037.1 DUF4352 domain-containing protein [Raineyella sp.]